MKIFTKYMTEKFLGPFLFGLGTFALLVFLGDLFDKMNKLTTSLASPGVIMEYLLLQVPYWTIRIVPVATLLAALFTVTGFVSSGEFVAVQAAGFSARRMFRPLLWMSVLIGVCSFAAQETILPASFSRSQDLWRYEIHPERGAHRDAIYVVGRDRILTASQFLTQEGRLERVVMDDYTSRGLRRQLDARMAHWDPKKGLWRFEDGVERSFDAETGEVASEVSFESMDSDLTTPPKRLKPRKQKIDTMSIFQLRKHIERLKRLGRPTHRARTGMHAKFAYPFTNLILCALGIGVALRMRHVGRPFVFASALIVSFFYIWLIEVGWHLGKAGRLSPIFASWIANVCFGSLSVWLYRGIDA